MVSSTELEMRCGAAWTQELCAHSRKQGSTKRVGFLCFLFLDPTAYHKGISVEGKVTPQIARYSGKGSEMKMKLARVVFGPQSLCVCFCALHRGEAYNEYMRYHV